MTNNDVAKTFGAEIRKEFMLRDKSVFLNHGSYGGIPRCVHERRVRYLEELEHHPDIWFRYNIYKYLRAAREKVADFMGINAVDTFLTENVTKAGNTVLKTFPLGPGQAYLVNTFTYVPFLKASRVAMSRVEGAVCHQLTIELPIVSADSIVQMYDDYLSTHTDIKLAIIDHITSPTCIVMPVKKLVEVCHKYDVIVLVDGAHVPGQLNPDIPNIDADFYVGTFHKWVYTPRSCAFIWTNPNRKHTWFKPLITSHWDGQDLFKEFSYEGTRDVSGMICSMVGIDYYTSIGGMGRIVAYTSSLRKRGIAYLEDRWGTKRLPIPDNMVAPNLQIIQLPVIPYYSEHPTKYLRLQKLLLDEYDVQVVVIANGGKLMTRISVQVYNTMKDFETLAEAILAIRKRDDLADVDKTIEL